MSKIRLISEGIPNLLPMQDRSPGIHVSDVIRDLCLRTGRYTDRDPNMTQMQLGCALEDTIARRYAQHEPENYVRPGELIVDDLAGTPDLVYVPNGGAVQECKLTWMSSRHDPAGPKFWQYWMQDGAYCHQLSIPTARLGVCHINGDGGGGGPIYRVWEREFTSQELRNIWRMLTQHRDAMRKDMERKRGRRGRR